MQRRAVRVLAAGALGLTALGLVVGCGGGDEGASETPFFNYGQGGANGAQATAGASGTTTGVNPQPGRGGTSSAPPAGTAGAPACPSGNCEAPPPVTVTQTCTPNMVTCDAAGALALCNAAGDALTTQACAAGSACAVVQGIPICQAQPQATQACSPNGVFCNTANQIGRCNADGSEFATEACPTGTNCTGAGTCTPVSCSQQGMLSANGNGGVTVYWFAQGTLSQPRRANQDVNCSFNGSRAATDDGGAMDRVAYIQDPQLFGAINAAQYAGSAACGACVQINPINGGQPVTITVSDSCDPARGNGTCTAGHIDLSRQAFQRATNMSTGDLNGITWRYVPCDGVDNVQFQLKEPNNQYWNEFLVVGHRFPIVKAEVLMEDGPAAGSSDGRWVAATRQSYNYWHPPEGMDGGDMGTFRVRVTDINGSIVEQQLQLMAGLQGGSAQFGCR